MMFLFFLRIPIFLMKNIPCTHAHLRANASTCALPVTSIGSRRSLATRWSPLSAAMMAHSQPLGSVAPLYWAARLSLRLSGAAHSPPLSRLGRSLPSGCEPLSKTVGRRPQSAALAARPQPSIGLRGSLFVPQNADCCLDRSEGITNRVIMQKMALFLVKLTQLCLLW